MYSGKITNFEIDVYKKPGDEILRGVKSLKDNLFHKKYNLLTRNILPLNLEIFKPS